LLRAYLHLFWVRRRVVRVSSTNTATPFARSFYLYSSAAVFVYYMSILIKLPGVFVP